MSARTAPPERDPLTTLQLVLQAVPARKPLDEQLLRSLRPELMRVAAEIKRAERRRLLQSADMEHAA